MSSIVNKSLTVDRSNIRSIQVQERTLDDLKEGEVLIEINDFALTANNISYAAIGELLQYWNFFPTGIEGQGIVPVWGYATVAKSKHPEIPEGSSIYGYLPMANYFVAEPGRITPHGFRDMAEHRQKNAVIYNNYEFFKPVDKAKLAGRFLPLIRPLFTTSFLLYYFFADARFMDANQIIITSASSKTALALASMLRNNPVPDKLSIIGLTSDRNKAFVKATNLFDSTLTYDGIDQLPMTKTVIADFAGNRALIQSIDAQLGENLIHVASIGLTDWESNTSKIKLPKAKMFFAPAFAEIKLKEWGPAKGMAMIKASMEQFVSEAQKWIHIDQYQGLNEAKKVYLELVEGKVDPKSGIMIKLG